MNNIESYVYFVGDLESNAVKIGKADDVDRRIGELQVGNPNPLTLLHSIKFSCSDEAHFYEKKYHKFFEHLYLTGEWFKFDEQIFQNFFLNEVVVEPKSKRSPLTVYTLFGEENIRDIKKFPRCFFYPYLVAQIKESYENSLKLKLPFRTMAYPTKGKKMLGTYSDQIDRVFISGKKHLENLEYKKFLDEKMSLKDIYQENTVEKFITL